jgi:SAM-dependent methyltransferase
MSLRIPHSLLSFVFRTFGRLTSPFDRFFLNVDIPMAQMASHEKWPKLIYEMGDKQGLRVLEIGSREVTGSSDARAKLSKAEYVGFDYYPGNNVDVVGDAHRLSSYFPDGEQFDLIYTSACFEHFAMPWVVAMEIAKMLKVGGTLFVETHFSFMAHERPWNFFQFSDMGLRVLFSSALGFECIEAGMSNPIVGRFSSFADADLRFRSVPGLYCHSEYLGTKVREVSSFDWKELDLKEVVAGTTYPPPDAAVIAVR